MNFENFVIEKLESIEHKQNQSINKLDEAIEEIKKKNSEQDVAIATGSVKIEEMEKDISLVKKTVFGAIGSLFIALVLGAYKLFSGK